LNKQGFVIVSSCCPDGSIHNSCKGIVKIDRSGRIYLLDLYLERTLENLKRNDRISIVSVDEQKFSGYCLKGRAKIVPAGELTPDIVQAWDEKIISRITRRLLRNIHGDSGHPRHPEAALPKPKYMILMEVGEIIDLTPVQLKEGGTRGE